MDMKLLTPEKPNIVEVTLKDLRMKKLREILEVLEPLRKYKALHKVREPLKEIGVHAEQSPGCFWFYIEHGKGHYGYPSRHFIRFRYYPEAVGVEKEGDRIDSVEELIAWVEKEVERESQPLDICVYEGRLRDFIEDNLCKYEMKLDQYTETHRRVLEVMEKAVEFLRKELNPANFTGK